MALGKTVLGTKETVVALVPTEDGILMQTLYDADEVKSLPTETEMVKVDDAELAMARETISGILQPTHCTPM